MWLRSAAWWMLGRWRMCDSAMISVAWFMTACTYRLCMASSFSTWFFNVIWTKRKHCFVSCAKKMQGTQINSEVFSREVIDPLAVYELNWVFNGVSFFFFMRVQVHDEAFRLERYHGSSAKRRMVLAAVYPFIKHKFCTWTVDFFKESLFFYCAASEKKGNKNGQKQTKLASLCSKTQWGGW